METLDYSNYQTVSAVPEAISMIETFRAIGYVIDKAVANILDIYSSAYAPNKHSCILLILVTK